MKTTKTSKRSIRFFIMLGCLFVGPLAVSQPPLAASQPKTGNDLLAVEKDGKSGFIDHSGKVVIPFQFDKASGFHDGLALVILKGKKYFIDTAGRILFEAKYDLVKDFSEGVAAVNIGEKRLANIGLISDPGKWGYIDKTGKLVIPMKFTHAEEFSEGLAAIKDGDKGAFIDHDAKIVFEVPLDVTLGFREGIAGVLYRGSLAYYDRTGKKISPPIGYGPSSHSFSEGLVPVEINGKTGFMDRSGKLIIEPQFVQAEDFSEGLAAVRMHSEETTWCPYDERGSRMGFTNKWGFIDKTGKMVIPPQYLTVDKFSEGLAAVNNCDEWFFIDKTGKKLVMGSFTFASSFFEGISRVNIGKNRDQKWGYIDRTGKWIWGPTQEGR